MKKLLLLSVLIVSLFLQSCSVQEKMNTSVFEQALIDSCNGAITVDESFYENGKGYYFVSYNGVSDLLITTVSDENGNIYNISVSGETKSLKELMFAAKCAFSVYCPDSEYGKFLADYSSGKDGIFDLESPDYLLNYTCINGNISFSVVNKKLTEIKNNGLTLKQNDKTYLKN